MIPKDILSKLGPTADRLNLSGTQLAGIVAAVTNHSDGDINDIDLSKSTARRHRCASRSNQASSIKKDFNCDVGQVNFDGKRLPGLGGFGKVNRLAVILNQASVLQVQQTYKFLICSVPILQNNCNSLTISTYIIQICSVPILRNIFNSLTISTYIIPQDSDSKILGIAETKDSTGRVEAEKVKEILDNWNVTEKIIALGFDTTSSNTGIRKGSCTILQQLLERQLLWLACRHHIPERIIAVSFITLFGETKGPDVPLFKTLKNCWDNLDLSNIKLPDIPSCYDGDVDSLLSYINDKLEPENLKLLPRCDYKEYLELALLFLGGSIDRKKGYTYQIQRPGADHHARWMSKAIYILKLSLLQHQIDEIHWQTKKKIHKMALFVVFIYLKAWFNSTSLTSAAKNDLELYKLFLKFKKIHSKISQSACEVLNRHTWYLKEDAITLTLFNEDICSEERTLYAKKIYELAATDELEIQKPDIPLITQKSEISDFIGERSRLLFDLLDIPLDFLADDEWYLLPEYASVKKLMKHLTPLNDSAERALALATRVNTHITRDEESYQELLQVVEAHRKKYGLKTKNDLKKLY